MIIIKYRNLQTISNHPQAKRPSIKMDLTTVVANNFKNNYYFVLETTAIAVGVLIYAFMLMDYLVLRDYIYDKEKLDLKYKKELCATVDTLENKIYKLAQEVDDFNFVDVFVKNLEIQIDEQKVQINEMKVHICELEDDYLNEFKKINEKTTQQKTAMDAEIQKIPYIEQMIDSFDNELNQIQNKLANDKVNHKNMESQVTFNEKNILNMGINYKELRSQIETLYSKLEKIDALCVHQSLLKIQEQINANDKNIMDLGNGNRVLKKQIEKSMSQSFTVLPLANNHKFCDINCENFIFMGVCVSPFQSSDEKIVLCADKKINIVLEDLSRYASDLGSGNNELLKFIEQFKNIKNIHFDFSSYRRYPEIVDNVMVKLFHHIVNVNPTVKLYIKCKEIWYDVHSTHIPIVFKELTKTTNYSEINITIENNFIKDNVTGSMRHPSSALANDLKAHCDKHNIKFVSNIGL